ncbi:MAG: hypothetical protein RPU72_04040 [Candidatus Sedimenticola sp. (ex Thyasira tokunagai)]
MIASLLRLALAGSLLLQLGACASNDPLPDSLQILLRTSPAQNLVLKNTHGQEIRIEPCGGEGGVITLSADKSLTFAASHGERSEGW